MVSLDNPGPPIEERDVAELEASLGRSLATSYRQFLMSNNGGTPDPDCIDVPVFGETDVQVFFGIGRAVDSSCISWNLNTLRERLLNGLVPIASDSGGNLFCLSSRDGDLGAVVYLDLDSVYGDLEAKAPVYPVSSSFEEFVASLRELS